MLSRLVRPHILCRQTPIDGFLNSATSLVISRYLVHGVLRISEKGQHFWHVGCLLPLVCSQTEKPASPLERAWMTDSSGLCAFLTLQYTMYRIS